MVAGMSVKSLAQKVAGFAPLLGGVLGGPGGAAIGGLVADLFGAPRDNPDALMAAIDADPNAAFKLRELQENNRVELERLAIQAETARLAEINATMRAEVKSDDAYVRRWRPTFGYAVALSWTLQMLGIVAAVLYAIFVDAGVAGVIIDAVSQLAGALSLQWSVALAVLGINVQARSRDKELATGRPPAPGLVGALVQRIAGEKS
jgi:hypothetical protein